MVDAPKDSILNTTKKLLGIDPAYTHFDPDITIGINTAFSTLNQLGVGPAEEFMIIDESSTWDEFIGLVKGINSVRSYVYYKVKLIFDPPATSFAQKAFEDAAKELEWRLNVAQEQFMHPRIPEVAEE